MASEDLFEDFSELDGNFADEVNGESVDVDKDIQPKSHADAEVDGGKGNLATGPLEQESKLFQLPLTRIRNLMKIDPDVTIASHEAVFAVTRSTELFIESLARESYSYTAQAKKKTIQRRDVDLAISAVDSLMFLEGAMNF